MMRVLALCFLAALTAVFTGACAPSKGAIDYTMSEGIIYPGPPEKPRIKYLWSLRRVSGGAGPSKFMRLVAGDVDYDISDPQNSDVLVMPQSVFVDDREILYIADPGAGRVSVIDLKSMDSFNIKRAGGGSLVTPIGVVVSPDGRVYVSDADLARVAVFNEKGKFMKFFSGEFKRPTGLAINAAEKLIYVADTWEHMVYVYGFDGTRKGSIGQRGEGPGKLNYPTHISVDADGLIYVSDTLNFRVQMFSPSGKFLNEFGIVGDSYGTFDKIKGIAVDTEGHIYVADAAQDMVKIFDKQGRLLLFFGKKGHFYGNFYLPAGIFIDSKDRIYVADSLNMRLQVFQFLGGD
jgi:DNA-binding beta-propeller fold protein YncE